VILLFIFGSAVLVGGPVYLGLWLAGRCLSGRAASGPSVHDASGTGMPVRVSVDRLAQGLIPAAGVGVFLGLSATTITLLQHEGVATSWALAVRFTLLALALAWSLRLLWRISATGRQGRARRLGAVGLAALGIVPFCTAWVLFFLIW
jgi:hypothetical protein